MNNLWLRKSDRPNLVLAPMAGYSDSAFRLLCREYGADIVVSEMVSADSIYHNKKLITNNLKLKTVEKDLLDKDKTLSLMRFDERERPFVVQLFGKYPKKFAFASKWVAENIKPDGIDINMGCPARKVVSSDHGVALLKDHLLAVEIVRAVRENIKIPLSIKTRLGWESDNEILEFAPKLIKAGADALIIHGRTYKDGFKNNARWENIYNLKSQISNLKIKEVAIIGNGDIRSYEEAIERSEYKKIKLDGVAIGRATFGNPNIFQDTRHKKPHFALWATRGRQDTNTKGVILRHAKLLFDTKGEHGIIEFRKHLLAYLKGLPNAKELRVKAVAIKTVEEVEGIVESLKSQSSNLKALE